MRKALGIVVALAVAALGTFLLVTYVQNAEKRALAGEEVVDVLVVDRAIPRGTPASVLGSSVRVEQVPVKVLAAGGISDLGALDGLVVSTDLVPGEQLVSSRFVAAETLTSEAVETPAGYIAVTVSLTPERAIGGAVAPGDLVAVVASFDPFALNTFEPSGLAPGEIIDPREIFLGTSDAEEGTAVRSPSSTSLILRNVLVVNLQIEQLPRASLEDLPDGSPSLAPTGNLLLTLAGPPEDIERLVFAAEHGFIWLGTENGPISQPVTEIVTRRNVYR